MKVDKSNKNGRVHYGVYFRNEQMAVFYGLFG